MTKNPRYSFLGNFTKSDKEYNCDIIRYNELTVNPDKDLSLSVPLEPGQLLSQGPISRQASSSNTTETMRHFTPRSLMRLGEGHLVRLLESLATCEEG